MNDLKTYLPLLTIALLVACSSQQSDKKTKEVSKEVDKATEVVNKAIEWAGGMDSWNSLMTINYTKRSRLLLEDESIEFDITQQHSYLMKPSLSMDINWTTDKGDHRLFHSDTASLNFLNGSLIDSGDKVQQSAFSAFYVLGMPFKLKDPGTYLSYAGSQEFNGQTADVIKASYSPEEHDNHSTSDQWWYYFDQSTGAFLGCMVYHAPTYALIENLAFHEVEGVKFQKRRMSYRCDSLGNKQFLRAEFWYEDYDVTFSQGD